MKPPLSVNGSDDFQTPPEALKPLLPFLDKSWVIWECAQGKGNLTKTLSRLGYGVVGTDILTGQDFLFWQPDHWDCIVTNPPYSKKQKFLERCYKLGKPFVLLLPLTALETRSRQKLYAKYGLQVILFPKRINFQVPKTIGSNSWFATAWLTNGLRLPRDLNFVNPEYLNQTKLLLVVRVGGIQK